VLIATLDGIGDGISVALWRGEDNKISPLVQYDGTGSLGWFYGNATEGLEWRHGSDEWKVMGLSPYGTPKPGALSAFHPEYRDGILVRPHEFGEFGRWNDHGANHYHGRDAAELAKIALALGREDYSAETQRVAEEQAMEIILPWLRKEKTRYLCSAGGFFLNVKFNQKLWYTGQLDDQWIYPNPGDAGLAVGAALHSYYKVHPEIRHERLTNLYFGPEFSNDQIKDILDSRGLEYTYVDDPSASAADYLSQNLVLGWFQGRMESGPRALGNRSILMSPTRAENKDIVNSKIKFREAFRPFCPSMLHERSGDYLQGARDEFFMTSSFLVKAGASEIIPAVVHVDGTARPQMVKKEVNPRYHRLIEEFGRRTGVYAIMNTSFNVKGEPIVCNPREAIRCFYDTGIDVLVLGNYVLKKPAVKSGTQ
jgi:carbamoyltransferase